jgi:hypothetical protein
MAKGQQQMMAGKMCYVGVDSGWNWKDREIRGTARAYGMDKKGEDTGSKLSNKVEGWILE